MEAAKLVHPITALYRVVHRMVCRYWENGSKKNPYPDWCFQASALRIAAQLSTATQMAAALDVL